MIVRPNIAFALTVPGAVRAFLLPHIRALIEIYDITIYSNFLEDPANDILEEFAGLRLQLVHIDFKRSVSLWADVISWWQLFWHLRHSRHTILHSMMPKTGFLATTAGLVARIPVRIHMFTGQVWASKTGLSRFFLKLLDWITSKAATHALADSPSQRNFLIQNGFPRSIKVLGYGSVSGVNLNRFYGNSLVRKEMRTALGLTEKEVVFGFLGRMNRDKGIGDLCSAFEQAQLGSNCHLVLVGPDEQGIWDMIDAQNYTSRARIHLCGPTNRPEDFFQIFDVYCLPSYREGFGTSVIEAAACGIPALVSRIYGLTDAVEEGVSGIFHIPANVSSISDGLKKLAANKTFRLKLAKSARLRVEQKYTEAYLVTQMLTFYHKIYAL